MISRCALAAASLVLAAAFLCATSAPVAGYPDGAPAGFSGGFGESGCDACHFEFDINAKPGQLTLSGVPERFTPGQKYTLTVTLARPAMKLGGFQMTARQEAGGVQAGTLAPAPGEEKRVAVDTASNIQYARQRREGAGPAQPGVAKWDVVWTAPATAAPVQFHVAANAADGDGAAAGDYVYAATARSAGSQ